MNVLKGDWQSARDRASSTQRWLLVNIQDAKEFQCQVPFEILPFLILSLSSPGAEPRSLVKCRGESNSWRTFCVLAAVQGELQNCEAES